MKKGGNITQNHSGLKAKNKKIPTNERRVYIQYILTDSEEEVISFYNFVFLKVFNTANVVDFVKFFCNNTYHSLKIIRKKYHAKVLLFGEYTVTMGFPALAIPFEDFFGQWDFESSNAQDQVGLVKLFDHISSETNLCQIYDLNKFEKDIENSLIFNSNIPEGYGLGSSGALVAACYDRYVSDKVQDIDRLKNILAKTECAFHGSSSGIDPLVSYVNKSVLISADMIQVLPILDVSIFNLGLLDTGISRITGPLVNTFKSQFSLDPVYKNKVENLGIINQDGIQSIYSNNPERLLDIFGQISAIQYDIFKEMIPTKIDAIWKEGLETGQYYIKLCGAGGGGMMLFMTKQPHELPKAFLRFTCRKI